MLSFQIRFITAARISKIKSSRTKSLILSDVVWLEYVKRFDDFQFSLFISANISKENKNIRITFQFSV